MASGKKFVRSANFSNADKALLISIISRYTKIVECKQTDGTTKGEKIAAWEAIARDFNVKSGGPLRTATSLRSCYENEKKRARKAVGDEKVEIFKTGGGRSLVSKITPLQEQVLGFIPGTAVSLDNRFDSDATYCSLVEKARGNASSSSALPPPPPPPLLTPEDEYENMGDVDESIPTDYLDVTDQYDIEGLHSEPDDREPDQPPLDWSNYTPKMLRTPRYQKPATSTDTRTPQKKEKEWVSRRRPSLQNPPKAEVNVRFENLASAKLELVSLQIQLMKDDNERKKQRDEEEAEMRRAVHQKVLDEYNRRDKYETEVHKKKIEILEAELQNLKR